LNHVDCNYIHLLSISDLELNWKCKGHHPDNDAWAVGNEAFVGIDLGPQIYENLQNGASGNG
jgi:hypothetical protein